MGYTEDFKKALLSDPHCILGKNGVTNEFITHVIRFLKKFKIIKIKALKSIANKYNIREIANTIAQLTESNLLDIRGRIFILSKYYIKKNL